MLADLGVSGTNDRRELGTITAMRNLSLPDEPQSAYTRALVDALGPHAGSTCGFTWPDRYLTPPEVEICIGLSGTHVLIWNPYAGGWFCDRIDDQENMLDVAHQLVTGAVVPRPDDVVAAVMLQAHRRLDQLPLVASETPVPPGTRLTDSQRRAVDMCDLTEDVALRLAVYSEAEVRSTAV